MARLRRIDSIQAVAAGSLVVLALLVYLLHLEGRPGQPVVVYCAAALRPAMEATAARFERETGGQVEFRFGNSGEMLGGADLRRDGDLFLPADDSYVRQAEGRGLVTEVIPLARMRGVVLTRPGNPYHIRAFDDLLNPALRLGQANPDAAAIGKVTRDHLRAQGKWGAFAARVTVSHATVTEAANAVQLGSNDAAIVWDAVAANFPDLVAVRLPELDGAVGRVELAILTTAANPSAARRFARYVAAGDRGLAEFRKIGFADVEPGPAWTDPADPR